MAPAPEHPTHEHALVATELGPVLLVSPVLEDKAMSRPLYLPKGTWYNFWTDTPWEGGRWLLVPTQVETMPVFARAGTILDRAHAWLEEHMARFDDDVLRRQFIENIPSHAALMRVWQEWQTSAV